MTVTISFPQPAERLNLNDRTHWAVKARATREWRRAAFYAAKNVGLHSHTYPYQVRVCFPVRTTHKRDASNWSPTIKAIVDGITDSGQFWCDDNTDWVEVMDPTFVKGASLVVVELIPRTGDAA